MHSISQNQISFTTLHIHHRHATCRPRPRARDKASPLRESASTSTFRRLPSADPPNSTTCVPLSTRLQQRPDCEAAKLSITMAANTKYTPAPQRDSFEEQQQPQPQGYTQAPPSYQAEPLLGEARSEDDNVPDDFKACYNSQEHECNILTKMLLVRRLRGRGDPTHSHAIHPQGLRHFDRTTPPHDRPQYRLLLL